MSKRPDAMTRELTSAAWPATRVTEAIQALATQAGFAINPLETVALPDDLSVDQLHQWIETSAAQIGIQAEQAFVALDDIDTLLSSAAPALIRLSALEGAPLLAIVGRRGRFVR